MDGLKQIIEQLGFPDTEFKRNSITITDQKIRLLIKSKNRWTLLLKRIDSENGNAIIDSYPFLKKISYPTDYDVSQILYKGLWLSYQSIIAPFLRGLGLIDKTV
jgi:hypothetical protein